MNTLKNPILNFRIQSEVIPAPESFFYDLLQGEHKASNPGSTTKYNAHNTCTMVTLTREAADSTENSG